MGFFIAVLWALVATAFQAPSQGSYIHSMDSVGGGPAVMTMVPTSKSATTVTTMDSVGGGPAV